VPGGLARGDGWRLPWCERRSLVDESVKVERGEEERAREKQKKRNFVGPVLRHEAATLCWKR
jgi:hypothetical protein